MAAKSTRSSGTDSVSYWTKKTHQQRFDQQADNLL